MKTLRPAHPLWRKFLWACSLLLLLATIGYVDVITGPDIHLHFLYAVPALLMAWLVGPRLGYVTAIAGALVWLTAEWLGAAVYEHRAFMFLNAFTHGLLVVVLVGLLNAFLNLSRQLEAKVDERTTALRALSGRLDEVEDVERRRLAQDIHDGMGQTLSLLKINLTASLQESNVPAVNRRVSDAVEVVDDLIARTRSLTFDLHPAMLDHLGLGPTLQHFAEALPAPPGLKVAISETGNPILLQPMTAKYLFRAVRELVNNAVKHGHARQILVNLFWQPHKLRLVVDDDGIGFNSSDLTTSKLLLGFGLPTIKERMILLNGQVRIESAPNAGTRVVLEVPLNGDAR